MEETGRFKEEQIIFYDKACCQLPLGILCESFCGSKSMFHLMYGSFLVFDTMQIHMNKH